jgi:hypothetical protein
MPTQWFAANPFPTITRNTECETLTQLGFTKSSGCQPYCVASIVLRPAFRVPSQRVPLTCCCCCGVEVLLFQEKKNHTLPARSRSYIGCACSLGTCPQRLGLRRRPLQPHTPWPCTERALVSFNCTVRRRLAALQSSVFLPEDSWHSPPLPLRSSVPRCNPSTMTSSLHYKRCYR